MERGLRFIGGIGSALLVVLLFALAGCSNQSVYETVQANRLNDCNRLDGSAREKCLEQYTNTYDEYEREREGAIKQD